MLDWEFLPTPSARRATYGGFLDNLGLFKDFYPRPPRGGRPETALMNSLTSHFYPRPPRGGRPDAGMILCRRCNFYPRPPRGGRPLGQDPGACLQAISTHALREEGDAFQGGTADAWGIFLPTPSARRATVWTPLHSVLLLFLPTPSARRATYLAVELRTPAYRISTHALREEGDHAVISFCKVSCNISTHALREEGDLGCAVRAPGQKKFLPTPSARRATWGHLRFEAEIRISTHALREEGD